MLFRSHETHDEAAPLLGKLAGFVPADGLAAVSGGADGETMRPLDFAPFPDRPARRLFDAGVVDHDLERLAAGQREDGGWLVDFDSHSPAAALEWRGYATVRALSLLRANGVV